MCNAMANQYATQVRHPGEPWSEPLTHESEAEAFQAFDLAKALGVVEAVAVLSRASPDKAWQVCANARKKFGYVC